MKIEDEELLKIERGRKKYIIQFDANLKPCKIILRMQINALNSIPDKKRIYTSSSVAIRSKIRDEIFLFRIG